jgi:hypothetical protein
VQAGAQLGEIGWSVIHAQPRDVRNLSVHTILIIALIIRIHAPADALSRLPVLE